MKCDSKSLSKMYFLSEFPHQQDVDFCGLVHFRKIRQPHPKQKNGGFSDHVHRLINYTALEEQKLSVKGRCKGCFYDSNLFSTSIC